MEMQGLLWCDNDIYSVEFCNAEHLRTYTEPQGRLPSHKQMQNVNDDSVVMMTFWQQWSK
jgi:hypothetical protein